MGYVHMVLLLRGFWMDLANEDTSRLEESRKRKVGVLGLCPLSWGQGLTVPVFAGLKSISLIREAFQNYGYNFCSGNGLFSFLQ